MMDLEAALRSTTAVFLLTYLVYSTLSLVLAWRICRPRHMESALSRVRFRKLALLLPIPLSAAAMLVPAPWLPVVPFPPSAAGKQDVNLVAGNHRSASPAQGMRRAGANLPLVGHSDRLRSDASDANLREAFVGESKRGVAASLPLAWLSFVTLSLSVIWAIGVLPSMACLLRDLLRLRYWIRSSRPLSTGPLCEQVSRLREQLELRTAVRLLESPRVHSPFAAGWWSPCILLPKDWMDQLSAECRKAVLAHELSHIARHDAVWNLLSHLVCRIFWFQPLNAMSCRHLRRDMEFVADQQAARMLDDPADLARSLVQLAERLLSCSDKDSSVPAFVAGMSVQASGLKERVLAVLSCQRRPVEPIVGTKLAALTSLVCVVLLLGVPRFGLPSSTSTSSLGGSPGMFAVLKRTGLITGFFAAAIASPTDPAFAQENTNQTSRPVAEGDSTGEFPEGLNQFSGMLIGKLVDRDIEKGSFTVDVQYVARVWENNKALQPRAVVGKRVTVNGVAGKWLDQLLLVRPGETVEFEAQHRSGDELTFPGEWLKKVAAFDPADHPVPPIGFRGFAGMVTGQIASKNPTSREIHLRIDGIEKTFEKNRASSASEAIGKEIVLAGFWARMSKPFDSLEKGDRIRAGVLHRVPQSDHFTVIELAEKLAEAEGHTTGDAKPSASSSGFPDGMVGFRGILRGKLVSKDVEQGTLVLQAERATRIWKANRASDTESCRGQKFLVKGISGKWIDVLITLKAEESIEVEAFHNSGEHLDFVSEWLKKVE